MMDRITSRWRKVLLWSGGGLLGLIVGVCAAWQLGALNGAALWAAGEVSGYRITCGTLQGGLLSRFTCTDFAIADTKGRFLQAKALSLDWNPWALIGDGVVIRRVALDEGVLTRLPQSQAPSSASGVLPGTKIAIADLAVRRFTLAIADAPRACVSLGGKATVGPTGFDASLALTRCAPRDGHATFAGHYDKPSGDLVLSAQGRDNGALVAALTGIESAGPTTVALDGRGTIASFNGTLSLRSENVATIQTRFDARDLTATTLAATFDIAPALLPAWAPRGVGSLNGDVTRGPNGAFDISSAVIDWAGLRGQAQLSLGASGALNGTLALDSAAPIRIGAASVGGLEARAELHGTKQQPRLHGTATFSALSQGSIAIATLRANFTAATAAGGVLTANVVGNAHGAALPAPAGGLLGSDFSFRATAKHKTGGDIGVDATLNGMAAHLVARADLGGSRGSGHLTIAVPDLAKTHAGFGGQATAVLDLPSLALNGEFEGTLAIRGKAIAATGAGAALGPAPVLTAKLRASGGRYTLSEIALETAAVAARGEAKLTAGGGLNAHLQTTRGDLKPLSDLLGRQLKGAFSLTADVSGSASAPEVKLAAAAPRLRIDNYIARTTALSLNLRKRTQWTGQMTLVSATPGGAVDLAADVEAAGGGWTVRVAQGQLGPAVLDGRLAKSGTRYSGTLTLKGQLLAPLGFALGQKIEGSGTLTAKGKGDAIDLVADLEHVKVGMLKDATLHADAALQGLRGPLSANVTVKDGQNSLAVAADGTLSPVAITLEKLAGTWSGAKFALVAPARLTMNKGRFALDRTAIGISGGTLTLAGQGGGGRLQGEIHLSEMPVAPIASLLQLGKAKGMIALDLTADMAPGRTDTQLKFSATGLMFSGAGKKDKPADVDADRQLERPDPVRRWPHLRTRRQGCDAHAPACRWMRAAGGYLPKLAQSGPVSAQLRAQLQAAV